MLITVNQNLRQFNDCLINYTTSHKLFLASTAYADIYIFTRDAKNINNFIELNYCNSCNNKILQKINLPNPVMSIV